MTKVKIYTEEQMSIAINCAKANPLQAHLILEQLTPIELPSDEEIYNKCSDWVFRENQTKWSVNDDTAGDNMNSFANGAKWMRKIVQGGNK